MAPCALTHQVCIPSAGGDQQGDLALPQSASALVLFAHGSGSGRRSPRNRAVGAADVDVLELNAWAAAHLHASHDLLVVPGAGHLFAEPGALEAVAQASCRWFSHQLGCR